MDAKIKARWVKALRSGEYQQTGGTLVRHAQSDSPRHCCLGVLCEITEGISLRVKSEAYGLDGDPSDSSAGWLSGGILRKVGLTQAEQEHLAHINALNDFDYVATYIEENISDEMPEESE